MSGCSAEALPLGQGSASPPAPSLNEEAGSNVGVREPHQLAGSARRLLRTFRTQHIERVRRWIGGPARYAVKQRNRWWAWQARRTSARLLAAYRRCHDPAECAVERYLADARDAGELTQDVVERLAKIHQWVYIYGVTPINIMFRRLAKAFALLLVGSLATEAAIGFADDFSGRHHHALALQAESIARLVGLGSFWLFQVAQIFRMFYRRWTRLPAIAQEAFWPVMGVITAAGAAKRLEPSIPAAAALLIGLSYLLAAGALILFYVQYRIIEHFRTLARLGRVRSRSDRVADILLDLVADVDELNRRPLVGPLKLVETIGDTIDTFERASPLALSPVIWDRAALWKTTREICVRTAAELRRIREIAIDAALPAQRAGVSGELRKVLLVALEGRWQDLPEATPVSKRNLVTLVGGRSAAPALIGTFAALLPHLPGVRHSPALANLQTGLYIAAAATLIGAPAEARKTISDAFAKASG